MSRAASPPLLDPFAPLWPFHRSWLETRASQIPFSPILQSAIGRLSDEDVSVSREAERPFSERSVLTRVAIACDSAAQQAQDPAVFAHLYLPLLYVSDALSFEEGSGSLEGLVERPASAGSSIGVVSRRFLSARSSLPLTAIRGASGGFYKEFIHLLEDLGLKPVITCPGPGIAQLSVCLHHGATLESSTPRPSDPTGLGLKLPSSPKISEPLAPEHIAALRSNQEKLQSLPAAFLASELGMDLLRFTSGSPSTPPTSPGSDDARRTKRQGRSPKGASSDRRIGAQLPDTRSAPHTHAESPPPRSTAETGSTSSLIKDRSSRAAAPSPPPATPIPRALHIHRSTDEASSIPKLQPPKTAPACVVLMTFDSAPKVSRDSTALCKLLEQTDGAFPNGHVPSHEGFSLVLEVRHVADGFNALFFRDDWPFDPGVNLMKGGAVTAWRFLEAKGLQPVLLLCPNKTRAVIGVALT